MEERGDRRKSRKALSKSILDMKFMKKSKEAAIKAAEVEEAMAAYGNELTEVMKRGGLRTILEPSFVPCEGLGLPRRSFHGANPEVEKIMLEGAREVVVRDVKLEPDADIQADEVARVTHAGTKLQKPPRKKQKFLKPEDD